MTLQKNLGHIGSWLGLAMLAISSSMASAQDAGTQQPVSDHRSHRSRLVLLGTAGGPVARINRSQPASMIDVNGTTYVIDAGEGVVRQLAGAGVVANAVGHIFLTHLHLDHTAGLAPLLGFIWVAARKQPINIIGPVGTASLTSAAIEYMRIPTGLHAAQLPPTPSLRELVNVEEISSSGPVKIFTDENISVWALENSHYSQFEGPVPSKTKSYSLKFVLPDRTIVFTGDTGPHPELIAFAKGADLLVSEVIDLEQTLNFLKERYNLPLEKLQAQVSHMSREHLSPEELGKLAQQAGVRTVVLSHIVMGLDSETDFRHYSTGVRKYFNGDVIIGMDMLEM